MGSLLLSHKNAPFLFEIGLFSTSVVFCVFVCVKTSNRWIYFSSITLVNQHAHNNDSIVTIMTNNYSFFNFLVLV